MSIEEVLRHPFISNYNVNNKNFSYEMLETATILLNSAIWFFLFIIVFIFIEKATLINIIISILLYGIVKPLPLTISFKCS